MGSQTDGSPDLGGTEAFSQRNTSTFSWTTGRVKRFFFPTFEDPAIESEFVKLQWYSEKKLLFFAVVYLFILNHSVTLYEKIVFYGPFSLITAPLPFLIYFNVPIKLPVYFNIHLALAAWYCAIMEIAQTKQCGFYSSDNECHGKDFLALLYYGTGFPTLILFAHGGRGGRLYHGVGQVVCLVLIAVLILPVQGIFSRNFVSFLLYAMVSAIDPLPNPTTDKQRPKFIQGFHWSREIVSVPMDAGRFDLSLRPFNLHQTMSAMLGSVRVATDAKGLHLNVQLDPDIDELQHQPGGDGLWVLGDPVRLGQVLRNLTSNAVKFSPSGEIKSNESREGQSGLGLAIVRQIIQLSDGRLGILSKKGEHATFWFELTYRIATRDEISQAQLTSTPGITETSSDKITEIPLECLVVDDDPLTRTLFSRMLNRLGSVNVTTATNGKEAVDIVLGSPPATPAKHYDLIFLDNSMPVMT
ncbi:hypothetical protein RQP46_006987 [Phenoliferia psychrophenolica]